MQRSKTPGMLITIVGVMFLPVGLQAAFAPRNFYDEFPFGRGWIVEAGGGYNEHLVRDVGGLFLALSIASLFAWWRPQIVLPLATAWIVQGVLHLVFHTSHLSDMGGVDATLMLASLLVPFALAVAALVLDLRGRPAPA